MLAVELEAAGLISWSMWGVRQVQIKVANNSSNDQPPTFISTPLSVCYEHTAWSAVLGRHGCEGGTQSITAVCAHRPLPEAQSPGPAIEQVGDRSSDSNALMAPEGCGMTPRICGTRLLRLCFDGTLVI